MSDSIEELSREYMDKVWETHSRSVGLFPIPEYPEFEAERGMWSTALDVLLTTLRYIAPATLLTIFWGQQSFLFKLLKYIDSAVRSLIFSNEEQKHKVLQWLGEAGPFRVDKLEVVWRHGWIVCGVLDAALPGACAGHPPTRLSLKHAQSIADNYLGVEPVFSRQELETNDTLSRHQEWKLINYLENIRQALSRITPSTPTNKSANTTTQKVTAEEVTHFTLDYIARGSGLVAAQLNHKIHFKIYPTAQQSLDPGEINILIHGPKNTYGTTVLPPILGKAQMIRQNLLGLQSKTCYTEKVLPITHGTTYLRSFGHSDINRTFYIPKTKYDIDIEVELKQDHARIGYVASLEGKYEVSITSGGQNVVGSPFKVTASNNIVGNLEKDNFCLEDGEEIDIVDVKTDRKVVLRIVDFVTEKMLLNENGTFEKISDEEARYLIETENVNVVNKSIGNLRRKSKQIKNKFASNKFYRIAKKVLTLCRVCKIFQTSHNISNNKILSERQEKHIKNSKAKQVVPNILNLTMSDGELKSHTLVKNRNRIIVPENITVSLLTEKPNAFVDEKLIGTTDMNMHTRRDSLENYNILKVDRFEDDMSTISVDTVQSNNPFVNDIYGHHYIAQKAVQPLIAKEYETHNLQENEERENIAKKIYIDSQFEPNNNQYINPFINVAELERPKTPVYKIISGEVTNRDDSVYVDPEQALLTDESNCSSLTNPFLKNESEITSSYHEKPDFIIGAPVSLPPVNFVPTVKPNIEVISPKDKSNKDNKPTVIHGTMEILAKDSSVETKDHIDDNYSSLDSNLTQDIIIISRSSPTPTTTSPSQTSRETSPRKDTWDSAYVSIDDNNCLSESNVSDQVNENFNKRKSPQLEDLSKMGPAEREIWQTDNELKDNAYVDEDFSRFHKYDLKRPEFTPIIEENERNILSDMKENNFRQQTVVDSVAGTYSEMNDLYDSSETISLTTNQDNKSQNLEIDYTLESNDTRVDSASDKSDVKRHTKITEGEISEVQINATESFSVSPTLHVEDKDINLPEDYQESNNNDEIKFCDRNIYSNIVLEKKVYWDDKIRQIEAKSEEMRLLQNKRKLTSKHLRRNDSISKRKGKKIVQHLKSGQEDYETYTNSSTENTEFYKSQIHFESIKNAETNVDKTTESNTISCFGSIPVKNRKKSIIEPLSETKVSSNDNVNSIDLTKQESNSTVELKPEVSEKVFQAFETSPKRFFGTSRKHILNKIDTFLVSNDDEKESGKDNINVNHESGLVSSRISLFHMISQTEELPCPRTKSKSMNNISHQNSEKNIFFDRINRDSTVGNSKLSNEYLICTNQLQESPTSLREKRARLKQSANNKSFEETLCPTFIENANNFTQRTIKGLNNLNASQFKSSTDKLKSISKSEMDIFNKTTPTIIENDLDKHKSYEELPKVSVKNFISLYEDVSKTSNNKANSAKIIRSKSAASSNQVPISTKETTVKITSATEAPTLHSSSLENPNSTSSSYSRNTVSHDHIKISIHKNFGSSFSTNSKKTLSVDNLKHTPVNSNPISTEQKEGKYLSLSDIDLEIVDNDHETQKAQSLNSGETAHLDYKNRFSKAKQFFQSLEELREERRLNKKFGLNINEHNSSVESLEDNRRPRKRSNIKKSNSLPSSEIAKAWNQLQEQKDDSKKLVKISEKFNVDDLFEDVMEGRLSRQGSLRGIPHKKAVLQTFKSMENVADKKLNSYEMAESQLSYFAQDNEIKNAQTYLTEYPYLPTTDPSKYHSRLDVNASGLITFKELKKIRRRNSVPDLSLNPTFTVDL